MYLCTVIPFSIVGLGSQKEYSDNSERVTSSGVDLMILLTRSMTWCFGLGTMGHTSAQLRVQANSQKTFALQSWVH